MKILHIQNEGKLSGAQKVSLNEFEEILRLKYLKHKILLGLIVSTDGLFVKNCSELGVLIFFNKFLVREISIFKDLYAFFKLVSIIKKFKPNIVHTHSSKPGILGRLAAKLVGVKKVIHTVHGFSFSSTSSRFLKIFYMMCEKVAGKFCDKIILLHKSDYDIALHELKLPLSKLVIIPNGLRISQDLIFNKNYEHNKKKLRIGFLGRLEKQKNPQLLLNSLKLLNKKYLKQITIEIGGDGELYKELEIFTDKFLNEFDINFHGWVTKPKQFLSDLDILILPSNWEGMPLVILEAFDSNTIVFCTNIPGNNHLVRNNLTGFLFPLNCPNHLCKLIEKALSRKLNFKKISQNAKTSLIKHYSLDKRITKILEIYDME